MAVRVSLLVVVVLAVAAGCGGGSKHASSSPATTTAPAASSTTTAKTTTGSSTIAAPSTTPTGPSKTSRSAFATPTHCTLLRSLGAKISQAVPPTFGVSRTNIAAETAALRALAAASPSDIRGDFDTYIGVFATYMRAFASVGLQPGRKPTHAQYTRLKKAVTEAINAPGIAAAEQHLKLWVRTNCPKPPKTG